MCCGQRLSVLWSETECAVCVCCGQRVLWRIATRLHCAPPLKLITCQPHSKCHHSNNLNNSLQRHSHLTSPSFLFISLRYGTCSLTLSSHFSHSRSLSFTHRPTVFPFNSLEYLTNIMFFILLLFAFTLFFFLHISLSL